MITSPKRSPQRHGGIEKTNRREEHKTFTAENAECAEENLRA
jgi:hypothetical protein